MRETTINKIKDTAIRTMDAIDRLYVKDTWTFDEEMFLITTLHHCYQDLQAEKPDWAITKKAHQFLLDCGVAC